jgi:hypothetical protein
VIIKIVNRKRSFAQINLKFYQCYSLLPLYNITKRHFKWLQNAKVQHIDLNPVKYREGLNRKKQIKIEKTIPSSLFSAYWILFISILPFGSIWITFKSSINEKLKHFMWSFRATFLSIQCYALNTSWFYMTSNLFRINWIISTHL